MKKNQVFLFAAVLIIYLPVHSQGEENNKLFKNQ